MKSRMKSHVKSPGPPAGGHEMLPATQAAAAAAAAAAVDPPALGPAPHSASHWHGASAISATVPLPLALALRTRRRVCRRSSLTRARASLSHCQSETCERARASVRSTPARRRSESRSHGPDSERRRDLWPRQLAIEVAWASARPAFNEGAGKVRV